MKKGVTAAFILLLSGVVLSSGCSSMWPEDDPPNLLQNVWELAQAGDRSSDG